MFELALATVVAALAVITAALIAKNRKPCTTKTIPKLRTVPILGNLLQLYKFKSHVEGMSSTDLITQTITGISHLFKNESLFEVYLGPVQTIYLKNPNTVEELLKSNKLLNKPTEYHFLDPWLGDGLLISDVGIWKSHRKLVTPAFHFRILERFQSVIDEKTRILVSNFEKHLNGEPFVAGKLVSLCAMDIICETSMGISLNAQDNAESSYVTAVNKLCSIVLERIMSVLLRPDAIFKLTQQGKEFYRNLEIVHNFVNQVIKKRKSEITSIEAYEAEEAQQDENCGKKRPFLDNLLLQHLQDPSFTEQDVTDEVNTFMFAGHDTTSTALNWALFILGHHPEVQQKIVTELSEIFSGYQDTPVTTEDTKQMKYMECVIKEIMRLYPPVPTYARKVDEDFIIDGYKLTKGAIVHIFVSSLHNNETSFPEPEKFIPERFLPENSSGRHPYAYLPFSAGQRNCIGQKFAMLEVKTTLANILRKFEIISVDPIDKIVAIPTIVLKPSKPIRIKIRSREWL